MPLLEFNKIYEAAFPPVFKVAWRICGSKEAAEDLAQDAFSRLFEKRMTFPTVDEAKFWLLRVVKNAALNYAKRKQKENKVYERAFIETKRADTSGESDLMKKETKDDVRAAITKLPEHLQEVLVLKEYTDLNYKEIGRALGISEGNVKIRVFRAREQLTKNLRSAYGMS